MYVIPSRMWCSHILSTAPRSGSQLRVRASGQVRLAGTSSYRPPAGHALATNDELGRSRARAAFKDLDRQRLPVCRSSSPTHRDEASAGPSCRKPLDVPSRAHGHLWIHTDQVMRDRYRGQMVVGIDVKGLKRRWSD
jgi:hypothetical protein